MSAVTVRSHAKINIFLHILGKRPDGYHDLYTLFTKIGLFDTITVTLAGSHRITCTKPDIPTGEKNIISKVDKILKTKYGFTENFHTHIDKNIPDGGGLGGGSSNAAAYLKAVLEITGRKMDMDTQTKIMAAVGSDTAFFLHDLPMIGEDRGEILSPYGKLPNAWILLVNPSVHVSTAQVFSSKNLTLTDRAEVNKIRHAENFEDYKDILFNGLEPAVLGLYPAVAEAERSLKDNGADFALMTGSGATVFGLFKEKMRAESALEKIQSERPEWKCFLTSFI